MVAEKETKKLTSTVTTRNLYYFGIMHDFILFVNLLKLCLKVLNMRNNFIGMLKNSRNILELGKMLQKMKIFPTKIFLLREHPDLNKQMKGCFCCVF